MKRMMWGCLAAVGSDALHRIGDIMKKKKYVDSLKLYLKTTARKLKLGCK